MLRNHVFPFDTGGRVKVADFGLARATAHALFRPGGGTPGGTLADTVSVAGPAEAASPGSPTPATASAPSALLVGGLAEVRRPPSTPRATMTTPTAPPVGAAGLPRATKDVPFTNSLGMKFVPVPGTDVLFCMHEVHYRPFTISLEKLHDGSGGFESEERKGVIHFHELAARFHP